MRPFFYAFPPTMLLFVSGCPTTEPPDVPPPEDASIPPPRDDAAAPRDSGAEEDAGCRCTAPSFCVDGACSNPAPSSNCFGPEQALAFEFIRNAPPPEPDGPAYRFYPVSRAVTLNAHALMRARDPHVERHYFLWANRCNRFEDNGCANHPKGNPPELEIRGTPRRFRFTTWERADACTRAQLDELLGASADTNLAAAGLRIARNVATLEASLQPDETDFMDVCFLDPNTRGLGADHRIDGVTIDYEVQDGRPPSSAVGLLTALAARLHAEGLAAALWTNPLNRPSARANGLLPSSAPAILAALDRVSILRSGAPEVADVTMDLQDQLAVWGGGTLPSALHKIYVIFELRRLTLEEARRTRRLVVDLGLAGIAPWRNGARITNDCAEPPMKLVRCLAYGECLDGGP